VQNEEQFCSKGFTMTYNSDTKHGRIKTDVGFTYGGYSGNITVHRRFVVKVNIQIIISYIQYLLYMYTVKGARGKVSFDSQNY
jgi:D-arabinose 1-dehydrogenase-like Zn-dependent alcohol dehydrogenase